MAIQIVLLLIFLYFFGWHPLTWIQRKSHRFEQGAHVHGGKIEQDPAGLVLTLKTWALYSVRCLKSGLSAPINALLKSLCAGNMNNCRNLFLKDGQPQKNIYILLFLFTEKVVVLFASSAFLKMSLRTTIFLGDFFGPLT